MAEVEVLNPQEQYQDLFKREKYRQKISELSIAGKTSLIVEFKDVLEFEHELAMETIENPDEYLKYANNAAFAQLSIEDREYAEKIETVTI